MTATALYNSILVQAIEGHIVPQIDGEESAVVLLNRIRARKEQLVKEKKGRADKPFEPINESEYPIDLPQGWTFCRLGELGFYKKGPFGSALTKSMFVPKSSDSIKVYEQKNAIQKDYALGNYYITSAYFEKMRGFEVHPGDIIVSCAGTIGETYVIPKEAPIGIINQALMRVTLADNSITDFWRLFFEYILISTSTLKGNGSAIKNIPPFEVLKSIVMPLPPLEEQKRIVAKVRSLLPLIEKYDKAAGELEALNKILPDKLRKSVLQEAIHGNLVSNDIPEGEATASELLQQILKERQDRENRAKGKKAKKLTLSTIEEEPWELPDGWCWCKLGDVISLLSGRDLEPNKYNAAHNGIPYITGASNFENGSIIINRWTPSPVSVSSQGDLLITCKGTVGELAFNTIGDIHIARQIMAISAILVDAGYIKVFLKAKVGELNAQANGVIPGISREDILLADFPLPPLSIQKIIVKRIDAVFSTIDELKA